MDQTSFSGGKQDNSSALIQVAHHRDLSISAQLLGGGGNLPLVFGFEFDQSNENQKISS